MNLTKSANRNGVALIWLLIGAMPVVIGCEQHIGAQPTRNRAAGSALEVVLVGPPVRKTMVLSTTQPARIEALEQTPIHSKLSSYVERVLVDIGDPVRKNQELLKLAIPELDAELRQKLALLEQSRSELRQAEAGIRVAKAAEASGKARVVQAEAGTANSEADVVRWKSEAARIEQLVAGGSVNRQLLDEVRQKLGAAAASLREAGAAVDLAKALVLQANAELEKATADRDAAEARVNVAIANVAQVQAARFFGSIHAPFDGVVVARQVDSGHFVQPAATRAPPLFVVARTDVVRVFVAVPEIEAPYVDIGDRVSIEVQALRGAEFSGQVTRTSVALETANRALTTIVDFENKTGRLRPGMFATAKIILQEQKEVLALPLPAIVRAGKDAHCFRLINGQATKTPVQLGIKVGDEFEITEGISEADVVILNKAASLKDGQQVDVAKPATK